jgi:hypothetical protein
VCLCDLFTFSVLCKADMDKLQPVRDPKVQYTKVRGKGTRIMRKGNRNNEEMYAVHCIYNPLIIMEVSCSSLVWIATRNYFVLPLPKFKK